MQKVNRDLSQKAVENLFKHFPRRSDFVEFLHVGLGVSAKTSNHKATDFLLLAMSEFLERWSDNTEASKKTFDVAFDVIVERFKIEEVYDSLMTFIGDYSKKVRNLGKYDNEYYLNLHQGIHWILQLIPFMYEAQAEFKEKKAA